MSDFDFLTTRSAEWSGNIPPAPQWTDRGDLFYVELQENEKLPLELIEAIPSVTSGPLVEKRKCTIDGRLVAVKTMDTYGNKATFTKLREEVEILRSLKHYHGLRTLGCYTQDDDFSIVAEPLAMCDLYTYLNYPSSVKAKKMKDLCGPRESFLPRIMGCLAHGLQYIHKEPRSQHMSDEGKMIRHRDITPANILLDGPRVLYADFGLSKFFTTTQRASSGPSHKTAMVKTNPRVSKLAVR